jgi:hemerythrin-like domain-containing protein
MPFSRLVSQALDAEHRRSMELLDRLERTLRKGDDAELAALARPLLHLMDDESVRHFAFEEASLFPRLVEAGDDAMAGLLVEEHEHIRSLVGELRPLLQAVAGGTLPSRERRAVKRLGLELVERMVSHIQKETMGLLPMLDDLLDEPTDRELAFAYAESC